MSNGMRKVAVAMAIAVVVLTAGGGVDGTQGQNTDAAESQPAKIINAPNSDVPLLLYHCTQYSFQFKYPALYERKETCAIRIHKNAILLGNAITITVIEFEGLTLSEQVNVFTKSFSADLGDWFDLKYVSIDGVLGIIVEYRIGGMGRYGETLFVEWQHKICKFSFFGTHSCIEGVNELDTFHRVLSTLRFVVGRGPE